MFILAFLACICTFGDGEYGLSDVTSGVSFDGTLFKATTADKHLFAESTTGKKDPCKMRVFVYASNDGERLHLSHIRFFYGVHGANSRKFTKYLQFGSKRTREGGQHVRCGARK